ncbi:MAG TPA: precorrin-2 C(20)-methyltransferase [Stellaceae bacterium]|nr:precorrin-2 C(20)-methyltransferase [Stellaceae bacterium]
MTGRLFGLGLGPGDPELLTLKALRFLRAADVVAYPAPQAGESFARSIVARWLDRGQSEIAIRFPMRPGPVPAAAYDAGAAALAAELGRGRDVALLCQGDPLVYGSFIELFARLAGRWEVEVVPGVSSICAAAAAARLPLASREASLLVLPATLAEADLARRLMTADTAVIVKLGQHLGKLRRVLEGLRLLDRAIYVERASLPEERILPLAAVEGEAAPYFSLAILRPHSTESTHS